MPEVIPFISTKYNFKIVDDLSKVLTPPYDVISPEDQDNFYKSHDYNIIRIILGKDLAGDDDENNKYIRASNFFNDWKSSLVMLEEEKASYYVYEQEFKIPGDKSGKVFKRRGFLGLVRLEPFSKNNILAHEQTFKGPKLDRFKLFTAVQANFCPIFMVYQDKKKETDQILNKTASAKPEVDVTMPDGITHRLWTLSNSQNIQKLRAIMKDKKLLIADGHHRYETALKYSVDMHRALPNVDNHQPFDYTLVYFNNSADEGMLVMPTHRILCNDLADGVDREEFIEDLEQDFTVKPFSVRMNNPADAATAIQKKLEQCDGKLPGLVVLFPDGEALALTLSKDADLDDLVELDVPKEVKQLPVSLLQHHIIPRAWIGNPEIELEQNDITYVHTIEQVIEKLCKRQGCVSFILNPLEIDTIFKIAEKGCRMPQKSTYFYPKLITGLACHDMSLHR